MNTLQRALFNCWNKDTCYPPMEKDWSIKKPTHGQCYSTTLIVNDYFGGKILKVKFDDRTGHFWNLINNKGVDLTIS
jgi:hypothetical protein